ncbi:MAG TPA: outer membrane lipoprotein LolB [Legionella sp.]|nr:outer membrane lipoprotein LolB [Legionella sp.]
MNIIKRIWLTSICLITACAAPQRSVLESPVEPVQPTKPVTRMASTLSAWDINGAIAAKSGKKAWTASLNWHQQAVNQYQIRLFGPLGGGSVIIEQRGTAVTYRDGPEAITSTHADDLLQKKTGVRLPVKNLYYWVRGIPAPASVQSAAYDSDHRLISLHQAGFTIDYPAYTAVGGMNLPSKIRLQGHDVLIKLVIKHWDV